MMIINDPITFRALVELAMVNGCFEPAADSTSSDGHLGPLLAYLEDLGGSDEFKFAGRLILSTSTEPLALTFVQEARQPDGSWTRQLEGQLIFEPAPRPRFCLRFAPMASVLSAS